MLMKCRFLLCAFILLLFISCDAPVDLAEGLYAKLLTSKGTIYLKLEYEKVPMTVTNFVGLAEGILGPSGKPFYDGTTFHRVIQDFMIQTGAPVDNVSGSPGYSFPDEFDPSLRHNRAGILSMANSGPDTNSSQFFITHKATSWLDDNHSVFGVVVQGQDVVDAIEQGDKIKKVTILRIGEAAESFVVTKESFDAQLSQAKEKREAEKRVAEEARLAQEALLAVPVDTASLDDGLYAEMRTSKGTILLELAYQKAPLTVTNFVGLAEGTLQAPSRQTDRYYDGLTFHRVVPSFMIQGGCPLGTGTGGPGYSFPDEFHPDLRHNGPGILSMANSGPDTNGSQFFITHTATAHLDDKHTVFGHVVQGMDVVNAIAVGDVIRKVIIHRIGSKALAFQVSQASFDQLKARVLKAREEVKALQTALAQKNLEILTAKARRTASGLGYIVDRKGSGTTSPVMGTEVTVHYRGTLANGEEFDSSYSRNAPSKFSIGQVIEGWNEALQMMHKGDKWTLIIPPELGYGAQGTGPIPPNATLIFEVELIDF